MIGRFVKWLEEKNLVDFARVTDDSDDGFAARFRIQKYVLIAQHMGLGTRYEYPWYIHGPHSSDLAEDYYNLAENPTIYEAESHGNVPEQFRQDDFLTTVRGSDVRWLEVATTLIDMHREHNSTERLVKHVANIKYIYPRAYTEEVLGDLRQSPMAKMLSYS